MLDIQEKENRLRACYVISWNVLFELAAVIALDF